MLVLTRKEGQRVFINAEIIVTVTKIGDSKVVLGFDAPKACVIQREELLYHLADRETKESPRTERTKRGAGPRVVVK